MRRRLFLRNCFIGGLGLVSPALISIGRAADEPKAKASPSLDQALVRDWLARWEQNILRASKTRYCDRELGEEIGWLMSPFLDGFHYGYQATGDPKWIAHFADWADSWIRRGVKEPDGFIGWPKRASGGPGADEVLSDSLLGEAMGLRPVVLMADVIGKTPALQDRFGVRARAWLELAGQVFEKWNARGCWREVGEGGLWVVPPFGLDDNGGWAGNYERRETEGFSNPANKQNHIARWLLAMYDVTAKPIYRERAEKWFRRMRSIMKPAGDGRFFVWNYWDPAGAWDYKPNGTPRHWVGVHPNGGYYGIDVSGIVDAFEHNLVFTREDIQRLVATNRDHMWNQKVEGAKFQRIDGGTPDPRWKNSPGVIWSALIPYDETLRKIFLANHDPATWNGLSVTPRFLARERA